MFSLSVGCISMSVDSFAGDTELIVGVDDSTFTEPPNERDTNETFGSAQVVKVYVAFVHVFPSVEFTYQVYSVEYDNEPETDADFVPFA